MNAVQTVKKYCPDTYREYVRSAVDWGFLFDVYTYERKEMEETE